jgi:2-succinyl-6-hydroxy-2,4-cyclohexadiene-1-carboxylate synthase
VSETLVLLHGFSGTRRAWDGVVARLDSERYRPLALDLPGHGEAPAIDGPITFETCVAAVLAAAPERFALCGYSLGGRIALNVALGVPERVSRLVLVSCSPGIEDDDERDERLAVELESIPFERFIEKWRTQPLFAEDPLDARELAREEMRRNDPLALAKAMRGLGTGEMAPLWSRLGELQMPSTFVAGERDAKFRAIGERIVELMPRAELVVIPGGHGLPLESPGGLAGAISRRRFGTERGRLAVPDDLDDPLPDDLLDAFEGS